MVYQKNTGVWVVNNGNPQKNISRLKLKKLKEDEIKELETKVLELEHELYYEKRNTRMSEMYSEKD